MAYQWNKWFYRIKKLFKAALKMALTSRSTFHTTTPWWAGSTTLEINGQDSRKERPVLIQWQSLHLGRKYFQEIDSPHDLFFFPFIFPSLFSAFFFLFSLSLFGSFISNCSRSSSSNVNEYLEEFSIFFFWFNSYSLTPLPKSNKFVTYINF